MRVSFFLVGIVCLCATAFSQSVGGTIGHSGGVHPVPGQVVLHVKDDAGLPITGAVMALQAEWTDENGPSHIAGQTGLRTFVRGGAVRTPISSNGHGELSVPASQVFTARQADSAATNLYVIDQAR